MTNGDLKPAEVLLPVEGNAFFRAGPEIDLLDTPTSEMKPILERLGPAPFRKPGFPVLGFLTTVYEHVAQHMTQASPPSPAAESGISAPQPDTAPLTSPDESSYENKDSL